MDYIQLNDGNRIPAIGFGVFMIPNDVPTYRLAKAPHSLRGRGWVPQRAGHR